MGHCEQADSFNVNPLSYPGQYFLSHMKNKLRKVAEDPGSLTKNVAWAILTLLLLTFVFSAFFSGKEGKPEQITINDLVVRINADEVTRIEVNRNDLAIELKSGGKAETKKETDASLSETLVNFGVNTESLARVPLEIKEDTGFKFWASIIIPTVLPVLLIGGLFWFLMRQAQRGAGQAFNFGKATICLFTQFKDRITFADVAGLKEAKEELTEVVEFLSTPKKFLDLGARIPRGVLLVGPPGTGKTLLARAVAGEANAPFFHMSGSEFVEMFVGVGASRVRDLFITAKKSAPSIIFIDEIDAVGRQRGAGLGGGNDEREQTLNQILVEMDGFDRETNVIIIGATNRPDILDPALLRPGRFDRRVILDFPDMKEREEILKIHAKNKPLDSDVDFQKIAVRTPGFSGADLANLVNEGAILTARQTRKQINQDTLYDASEKVILGPERRSRIISTKEKEITAYHEAGHALVASSMEHADPVHKISIIARGRAGGYTLKLPTEDRNFRTRSQFLSDLAVYLGGYAAEKLVFHELSTGASSDLKGASELARRIVTQYGMSDALGPVTFGDSQELVFLGREMTQGKNYSEEIAYQIDQEIKRLILEALKTAESILTKRMKILKVIADSLMEKETLEQDEYNAIVGKFKLKPLAA